MGETAETTAERLSKQLRLMGWTQRRLARAIGASEAVVCRIVSGERPPSLSVAFRIQEAVSIPADAWVHSAVDESGEHPAVLAAGNGTEG